MTHSPEPWKEDDCDFICDTNGNSVIDYNGSQSVSQEDVARIVACVNACAGIPTEELTRAINGECKLKIVEIVRLPPTEYPE